MTVSGTRRYFWITCLESSDNEHLIIIISFRIDAYYSFMRMQLYVYVVVLPVAYCLEPAFIMIRHSLA